MKYKCPDCGKDLVDNDDLQYIEREEVMTKISYKFDFKLGEETTDIIDTVSNSDYNNNEYTYMCGYCESEAIELVYFEAEE